MRNMNRKHLMDAFEIMLQLWTHATNEERIIIDRVCHVLLKRLEHDGK